MNWLPVALFAITLVSVAMRGYAQNIDCRSCHAPYGVPGIRDLTQYYIHPPDGHPIGHGFVFNHQVGQKYPAIFNAIQKTNCSVPPAPKRRGIAVLRVKSRAPHTTSMLPACQDGEKSKFKAPNGRSADIMFFDSNGNGQPDNDEVQLFAATDEVTGEVIGESGNFTVECSSCHKAHGNDPDAASAPGNFYLRVGTVRSTLCLTCHNK